MNQQRMTVHDAARRLGISEDAVRMRIKRGKLDAEREGGRLYVRLTDEPTAEPTDRTDELIRELRERVEQLSSIVETRDEEIRRRDVIISQLTSRIPELEPAPSQEPSESPSGATAREQPGRVGPQTPLEGAGQPSEPPEMAADEQQGRGPVRVPPAGGPQERMSRPWWRRMFGA
jgi:excisionase family DNA binding protein